VTGAECPQEVPYDTSDGPYAHCLPAWRARKRKAHISSPLRRWLMQAVVGSNRT